MRVGIVGLGFRMGYLAHVFTEMGRNFEVAGYVDPAPAGLPSMREKGVAAGASYESVEALLANEKIDLLMIGSPNHMHLDHIRQGLEAGCRVFSEKPIVATVEQSYALARLIARYGRDRLMVGLVLRYAPMYKDLRAAQAQGLLGDIVSIEASEHIEPGHGAFFMRDWRRYEQYAGGFMLEKCCHDLDLYNGVVGARPERVASFGGRKSFTPQNAPANDGANDLEVYYAKPSGWMGSDKVFDSDGDIVDFQTAIVEYENGVSMTFHTNLNVPDQFRRFCVIGAKGMAEGDFIRGYLSVHEARTNAHLIDKHYAARTALSQHYGADEQMAADVTAHVLDGAPLPVSAIDALEAGLLAMAMDEARRTRKVIEMREIWDRFDLALSANAA
ncbi:Gfo/Idh/MocA family protein [Pelagibacterium xiamenense]|uniref:Gfo/Idh/MocA family protein n=1 Tax=Pelagibacterium xiamenense TaxID=2901140 RepID=UPI001E553020|nr:Gfo/Idh/MocA family oxidoreductase [Pelagibacterium xiamenense]MCD7059146.1 Gfo/Idh/MocA family oxidoreductase [Pelagibacterium xiamenense]